MQHELWLLRHAKSDWDSKVSADFERSLAKKGEKAAVRMGRWLAKLGKTPQRVICSNAVRARQTLELLNAETGYSSDTIIYEDALYLADLPALLKVIHAQDESLQRVLLVGHNPGLDLLLLHLCGDKVPYTDDGKLMTTACLAMIRLPGKWTEAGNSPGSLIQLLRPRQLVNV